MSSLKLKLIAALLMGHLVPCALATNEVCWVGKVGDDCRGQPDGCTHHGVLVLCEHTMNSNDKMAYADKCSPDGQLPGTCHCDHGISKC